MTASEIFACFHSMSMLTGLRKYINTPWFRILIIANHVNCNVVFSTSSFLGPGQISIANHKRMHKAAGCPLKTGASHEVACSKCQNRLWNAG